MRNNREGIRGEEFWTLQRKLWVETCANAIGRPWGKDEYITPQTAASLADQAVVEFGKRFQPVI